MGGASNSTAMRDGVAKLCPHPRLQYRIVRDRSTPERRACFCYQTTRTVAGVTGRLLDESPSLIPVCSGLVAYESPPPSPNIGIAQIHQPNSKPYTAQQQQAWSPPHLLRALPPHLTSSTRVPERRTRLGEESTRLLAQGARLVAQGASGLVQQGIGLAPIRLHLPPRQSTAPAPPLRI